MANKGHIYLARLYHRFGGICHWCGCKTWLKPAGQPTKSFAPLMATRDHLDDRFSSERGTFPGRYRLVLACNRCNNERARISQASRPIEELRARAGRPPSDTVLHTAD